MSEKDKEVRARLGVDEKTLSKLKYEGWESPLLDLRLRYAELESIIRYVKPLQGVARVHPHFLPTQKSGRWSTTNPPLANFSANCINPACDRVGSEHRAVYAACWSLRDLIVPDEGWYFIKWDWSAIEAKLAAAYSGDTEDLGLFERGEDIHVVTLCRMYGLPLPPNLKNPHTDPSCEDWRAEVGWGGKDDWRRIAAKTTRYSLAYAIDQRGIHEAKDVDQLARQAGLDKKGLEALALAYLNSKPRLLAWKRGVWKQVYSTYEVRTPLGRRKRLFVGPSEYTAWMRYGRPGDAGKQGLNHLAQGQVADMMNLTIIAIKRLWLKSRFVYQAHDGLTMAFPEDVDPFPAIREVVERKWDMKNGLYVKSTADWAIVRADGGYKEVL